MILKNATMIIIMIMTVTRVIRTISIYHASNAFWTPLKRRNYQNHFHKLKKEKKRKEKWFAYFRSRSERSHGVVTQQGISFKPLSSAEAVIFKTGKVKRNNDNGVKYVAESSVQGDRDRGPWWSWCSVNNRVQARCLWKGYWAVEWFRSPLLLYFALLLYHHHH